MKRLNGVIALISAVLLFVTGGVLIWRHFPPAPGMPAWMEDFLAGRLQLSLLGVLFIVLSIAWLFTFWRAARGGRSYVSFDNPGGAVRVSLSAIADFLSRLSGEFPWIVSVRPVVSLRERALQVDLQCRVKAGSSIPDLSQQLQDRVRQAIEQSIGLAEISAVSVSVREIVGEPKGAAKADAGGEPKFNGRDAG